MSASANIIQELKKEAGDDVKFRRGKYDDVKAVFDALSDKERYYVAPGHPDFYGHWRPAARTVAYMSGKPVGFADLFDEASYIGDKGKRRASVEIAVLEAARRNGIAKKLAIASIAKALKSGRFDDIDWAAVHGNKPSVALAKKLGFRRNGWHWHPRYTMSKEDFENIKQASDPTDEELRRMYDILQADAKLSNKVEGLGFGRNGDAYRRAAIKLRVMELARLLQDGKRVRNRIAHTPGYVPSRDEAERALRQYADADARISGMK